jgi:cardiolipin synthase A/B
METKRTDHSHPDRKLIHFLNYYLANGPLNLLAGTNTKTVESIRETFTPDEAVYRYHQEQGGAFTSNEQLAGMPGMNQKRLDELDSLVSRLDLVKLKALAPKTSWNNQVEAYVNGPDSLAMILSEIEGAQSYIHLSVMQFFNDQSGNLIVDALLDAINRGVKVRAMVNFENTLLYGHKKGTGDFRLLADKLEDAGGKVIDTFRVCYNNRDWSELRIKLEREGVSEEILFLQDLVQAAVINTLDVVNHRKYIIIDGNTSILGSLNFGDMHLYQTPLVSSDSVSVNGKLLGIPRNEEEWHDGCFRIRGAAAQHLNQLFASQWIVMGGDIFDANDSFYFPEMDRNCGDEECTLFTSFPGNPINLIQQYFLALVTYAAAETVIINPYLIDQVFWDRLKCLEEEPSSHISICNPLKVNDIRMNQPAVRCNMFKPFQNGIAFFDYSKTGRFSHWKIAYDNRSDCVFHGSYNLNTRSAIHDFEVGVLVKSKPFADKIKKIIDYDLNHSEKIENPKEFYKYPMFHPGYYINAATKYFS